MIGKVNKSEYDLIVKIKDENDIVLARQLIKNFTQNENFGLADTTKIVTAVSELARNIFRYSGEGYILAKMGKLGNDDAIEIVAVDSGPGIENVEKALERGFTTTKGSLGLGLSGVRRLMDDFYIKSNSGVGTLVRIKKKKRKN